MFGTIITQKEALKMIPGASKQRLDELVEKYKLFKTGTGKNTIYVKETLHLAINLDYIKALFAKHNNDWLSVYVKINSDNYQNPLIYNLSADDIINNQFADLKIPEEEMASVYEPIISEVKGKQDLKKVLKPVPAKMVKYVIFNIYCKDCRKDIYDSTCNHEASRQTYRIRYTIPKSRPRKSKYHYLDSRGVDDAIVEAKIFMINYKNRNNFVATDSKPPLLVDAIKIYKEYIDNKDNRYKKKTNSKNHIADIKRNLDYLIRALEDNGYEVSKILVVQVRFEMACIISRYLENNIGLKESHYRAVGQLSSFFKWLINYKGYLITNPFYNVDRERPEPTPVAITEETFKAIINLLDNPINWVNHKENPGINLTHTRWLKVAYLLSVLTGRRREELLSLRWSSITINDKSTKLLRGENLKVVRLKNQTDNTKKRMFSVPLFPELKKYLFELGYEENIGSNDYIIFPEKEQGEYGISRKQMKEKLSRSFAFLIKQIEHNQGKLTFRSIRKIFTSRAKKMYDSNAGILTDHRSGDILDKHYNDTSEFLKEVEKEFYIFEPVKVLPPVLSVEI